MYSQGPNRTFGAFKKTKEIPELNCTDNCATIVLVYEKGTFINNVKAAIGIDDKYAIASEKSYYAEYKIPAGIHKIMLPQGVNQAGTIHVVIKCESTDSNFIALCSKYSNMDNYQINIGKDITELEFNKMNDPYTTKMFASQINYLTYKRMFKAGQTYYYKALKLPNGVSLSCGPLITETSEADFNNIINGSKIKDKGEICLFGTK